MLLVLVSFWLSGTCGLIDLLRALCLVETWRTPYQTGAWVREKVLARKAPSLLWGVWGSHLIVHPAGPQWRPHSEIWKGGDFPPWHRTSIFFVLILVQSHLAPRLYTWPSPTGSGEPSSRGVSYKERLPETLQPPGLNKHFLGVSQSWEEILCLCPFYSWICWASDHCVICPGSLFRSVGKVGFEPRLYVLEPVNVQVFLILG